MKTISAKAISLKWKQRQTSDRAARRRAQRDQVVRRAAAAAASSATRSDAERRSRQKFLVLVTAIVLAGTLLVGFTWADRQYNHPTVLDSWQNAYGVFDCTTESWTEPFTARDSARGIRSRADGIIYIEPADESVAGDNATLGVFLDAIGADLTDDTFVLPDGSTLAEQGTFCRGEEAFLQVQRWDPSGDEPVEIGYDDLHATRFEADRQSLVIALAPAGATIPPPPSAAGMAVVDAEPPGEGG